MVCIENLKSRFNKTSWLQLTKCQPIWNVYSWTGFVCPQGYSTGVNLSRSLFCWRSSLVLYSDGGNFRNRKDRNSVGSIGGGYRYNNEPFSIKFLRTWGQWKCLPTINKEDTDSNKEKREKRIKNKSSNIDPKSSRKKSRGKVPVKMTL